VATALARSWFLRSKTWRARLGREPLRGSSRESATAKKIPSPEQAHRARTLGDNDSSVARARGNGRRYHNVFPQSREIISDGARDEILTRLAKIADLKVISRTSTQHYKSVPENLRDIASQLGVAHILEGSVQKSGDAVRVNVQLIKADDDSHLWADTFDRKLTDIFSVESEIAKAIADQLRAKLTGREEQEN